MITSANAVTSITRSKIELAVARCSAIYALILYGISLPDVIAQIPLHNPTWDVIFMAGIPVAILWTALTPRPGRMLRVSAGTAAMLLLCSFLLWHVGLVGDGAKVESRPWSSGISGIGIALAAVAAPARVSAVYGALFCVLIAAIPLTTAGSVRSWGDSMQDALLAAVLGVVIIAPITALRRAATATDRAAAEAKVQFEAAAKAQAIRIERNRVDRLTHDTVLATLIVASQTDSAEMIEANQQSAREALRQIHAVDEDDDGTELVSSQELVNRLRAATAPYRPSFTTRSSALPQLQIPLRAVRALVQATTEAARNNARYSPNSPCEITAQAEIDSSCARIRIEIRDEGPGFDIAAVSPERLGLRISIVQRMAQEGGHAAIISSPGKGALIRLNWQQSISS